MSDWLSVHHRQHLLKSAFLIDRSQSWSQSQASTAYSLGGCVTKCISFERDNWKICSSSSLRLFTFRIVYARCTCMCIRTSRLYASLKRNVCRHLYFLILWLAYAFMRKPQSVHAVTTTYCCKWLINGFFFLMRNSGAKARRTQQKHPEVSMVELAQSMQ